MSRLAVVSCVAFVATSSYAQVDVRTLTLAGVSDCITEAIATNLVEGEGSVIVFSCNASKAKTLYNFLGRRIRSEVVQDRNGKFENRQFGNSACYHRVEDQNGKTADEFRCDLIMPIGDLLSE
jgi:hypothetical protein